MAFNSAIEWTDATWNPWHGCHKVSAGCKNCYMFRDKARYGQDPNVVVRSKDATFYAPLKWKEPRLIFTCSWSDFFIEEADAWRDEAFAIMALTPQHTYQVLTKRPDRMLEYFRRKMAEWRDLGVSETAENMYLNRQTVSDLIHVDGDLRSHLKEAGWFYDWNDGSSNLIYDGQVPLPNVWLGVSVEDQKTADERIPDLLNTPAAVRFLSVEPLLEEIIFDAFTLFDDEKGIRLIDWVIAGGESGPDARPMHPDWVRSIRDQCQAAGVPFFFKQWGEWVALAGQEPGEDFARVHGYSKRKDFCFPIDSPNCEQAATMYKVGKKAAGRLLDGREWNEYPGASDNEKRDERAVAGNVD